MILRILWIIRFAPLLLPFGLAGCGKQETTDEPVPSKVEATTPPPKPGIELGEPPRLPPEEGETR